MTTPPALHPRATPPNAMTLAQARQLIAARDFTEARDTLEQGLAEFPDANEMRVFLAMADHNLVV